MAVHELHAMTWEEIARLDPARAVAILPVGATEAHGPHLPVATDVWIAEAMASSGAERLAARGVEAILLPAIAYTPAGFAASFAGTISIPGDALRLVIEGIVRSLASMRITRLVIANAHLDPENLSALHDAVDDAGRSGVEVLFPDITRKPWGSRLTAEFRSGACHAGRYETSIILAIDRSRVRESLRVHLAANDSSLSVAIRNGIVNFTDAGGPRAYFGAPAEASVEEGEAIIATLGSFVEEIVMSGAA